VLLLATGQLFFVLTGFILWRLARIERLSKP